MILNHSSLCLSIAAETPGWTITICVQGKRKKPFPRTACAALVEAERLKEGAMTEIEQERQRAKEQLRGELSALTMQGAQKVLGAEINQSTHERLIEELAENW